MDNELIDLCKKVHQLGLFPDFHKPTEKSFNPGTNYSIQFGWTEGAIPLYTSDYLLQKLPKFLVLSSFKITSKLALGVTGSKSSQKNSRFWAGYGAAESSEDNSISFGDPLELATGDTPLKALLKLTLALHEAGELK